MCLVAYYRSLISNQHPVNGLRVHAYRCLANQYSYCFKHFVYFRVCVTIGLILTNTEQRFTESVVDESSIILSELRRQKNP